MNEIYEEEYEEIHPQDDGIERNEQDKKSQARETAQRLQSFAQRAKHASSVMNGLISTVANPYTWIAIGISLLIIMTIIGSIAFVQVVGKTDNADGCYDIGSTTITVQTSEDMKKNQESIAGYLTSTNFKFLGNKPFSKNQAGANIGNYTEESQANPNAVQPSQTHPEWSNDDVRKLGTQSGRAAGFAQWDGSRRLDLVNFADEKGKKWNDLGLQLEFLKKELDGGEGTRLLSAGFNDSSKSVSELTELWNRTFERSADYSQKRSKHAEEFLSSWDGGSYSASSSSDSNSGGSCLTDTKSASLDTSDVAKLAASLSYPVAVNDDNVTASDSYGGDIAKKEYKEAKKKAEQETSPDPMPGLYASCDRFVATVIKVTVDKDIPWGSTSEQHAYLDKSNKWQSFTKMSEAKPGDIFVTVSNGHIMLFLGEVDGRNQIAHASYLDRVAGMDYADQVINDNLVDNMGRQYVGYHFKGDK